MRGWNRGAVASHVLTKTFYFDYEVFVRTFTYFISTLEATKIKVAKCYRDFDFIN